MNESAAVPQFSRGEITTGGPDGSLRRWRVVVALAAVFVIFFQLGGRGLNEPDEGRYAEAGREMMASGDYLTPRLNGKPHYTKPPLTYWLIAAGLNTFGVNEFGARLPSALGALGTLLAVYLIGRRALGVAGALWAVVILLSSVLFVGIARLITTDMLMTCWVTWAVWAIWRWSEDPERRWRSAVWVFVFWGLGLMTKGPVPVVLSLFALAGLRWRNPGLRPGQLCWGRGVVVMLAIALPWFLAVTWGRPELWGYFLGRETVGRVFTQVHGRGEPWWYFLPVLAGGMLPWTPWLALTPMLSRGWSEGDRRLVRMCVGWAGLGFLLFTLSRSKLPTYVLPLMPPLALLLALTVVRLPARLVAGRVRQGVGVCLGIAAVLLLGAGVALLVVAPSRYDLAMSLAAIPLGVAVVGVGLIVATLKLKGLLPGMGMLVAALLSVVVSVVALIPGVERNLGGKTPAKLIAQRILAEDPEQQSPVVAFGKMPLSLPFYLNRKVLLYDFVGNGEPDIVGVSEAEAALLINDRAALEALLTSGQRVFCVVDQRAKYQELEPFGLRELERDSRRVLLVNTGRGTGSNNVQALPKSAPPPDELK